MNEQQNNIDIRDVLVSKLNLKLNDLTPIKGKISLDAAKSAMPVGESINLPKGASFKLPKRSDYMQHYAPVDFLEYDPDHPYTSYQAFNEPSKWVKLTQLFDFEVMARRLLNVQDLEYRSSLNPIDIIPNSAYFLWRHMCRGYSSNAMISKIKSDIGLVSALNDALDKNSALNSETEAGISAKVAFKKNPVLMLGKLVSIDYRTQIDKVCKNKMAPYYVITRPLIVLPFEEETELKETVTAWEDKWTTYGKAVLLVNKSFGFMDQIAKRTGDIGAYVSPTTKDKYLEAIASSTYQQ
jgi:hypothetical protein